MSRKSLILVGGGGNARACADIINTIKKYKIIGYTDVVKNKFMSDYNYLETDDILSNYINNSFFIIAIGHDTFIDDYSTTECSDMIAGNNIISESCYFGMNSSTKQGVSICKNVIIGLNAGVVKNITKPGTYVGTPSKNLS